MNSVSLFSGIGGFELGFHSCGIQTKLLCEIEPAASAILRRSFSGITLKNDVRKIKNLPNTDVVVGGFPCQDLSLAGVKAGINGSQSGLVNEYFRLINSSKVKPKWLVLENVPFMLWQKGGEAMRHVIRKFEDMDYRWAYRVIDSRCFGLPQRRRRVIFVASQSEDPNAVLFSEESQVNFDYDDGCVPCGFFWTEGRAGLGWAVNGVPTLKGGSSIGIPSLPAIWFRDTGMIGTPSVTDAERLQGFKKNWTLVDINGVKIKDGYRCKLVGNAVNVPLAKWLGSCLLSPGSFDTSRTCSKFEGGVWPNAAFGANGIKYKVQISEFPAAKKYQGIAGFLKDPIKPLSFKASSGFLKRARIGSLNFSEGFLDAVENHIEKQKR